MSKEIYTVIESSEDFATRINAQTTNYSKALKAFKETIKRNLKDLYNKNKDLFNDDVVSFDEFAADLGSAITDIYGVSVADWTYEDEIETNEFKFLFDDNDVTRISFICKSVEDEDLV